MFQIIIWKNVTLLFKFILIYNGQKDIINESFIGPDDSAVFDGENIKKGVSKVKLFSYPIYKEQLDILTEPGAGFKGWAIRFILISLGSFSIIATKWIEFSYYFNDKRSDKDFKLDIDQHEINNALFCVVVAFILFGLGFFFKNKKDKLIEKIKNEI